MSNFISSLALAHDVFAYMQSNNNIMIDERFTLLCQQNELLPRDEPPVGTYERGSFNVRKNELRFVVDKEFQNNGFILDCISREPTTHEMKELDKGLMDKTFNRLVRHKKYNRRMFRRIMKAIAEGYGKNINFKDPIVIRLENSLEKDFDGLIDKMELLMMMSQRKSELDMIENEEGDEEDI